MFFLLRCRLSCRKIRLFSENLSLFVLIFDGGPDFRRYSALRAIFWSSSEFLTFGRISGAKIRNPECGLKFLGDFFHFFCMLDTGWKPKSFFVCLTRAESPKAFPYAWHGLKAQKHLAQGNALGKWDGFNAPWKGKSIIAARFRKDKAFALSGRRDCCQRPRALP